jgi:M6 family metalloprotease-like protein
LESYFNANSRNIQFTFNLVGIEQVVDPRTMNCAHRWSSCATATDGAAPWMATVEQLEMLPAASLARISEYDRNDDGLISADELFVLKIEGMEPAGVIGPYDDNCGLNRRLPRAVSLPGGKQLAAGASYLPIGDEANVVTTAHEFAHLFGARDLYGSGNNFRSSVMGATCFDGEALYHLDPWHKMRMGLVTPRIIPIPRTTSERQSIRLTIPANEADYEPVLFYNQDQPTEYFMVEYRRTGAGAYDGDVHSTGLMIWHVATDSRFVPLDYSNPPFGGSRAGTVATVGAPGQTVGRSRAWLATDGVVALNWPGRGDSGLRVRVIEQNDLFLTFEWWRD